MLPSLEHSHVHLFTHCLWLPSHHNSELGKLQQRSYACKTENIYSGTWLLLLLSRFSRVRLYATPQTGLCSPPGKNTGVGCHFLLQCMKVKSESEVAQPCPTPSDPMDCSTPGSSVHGIFQTGVLEWGAIAFSNSGTLQKKITKQILIKYKFLDFLHQFYHFS